MGFHFSVISLAFPAVSVSFCSPSNSLANSAGQQAIWILEKCFAPAGNFFLHLSSHDACTTAIIRAALCAKSAGVVNWRDLEGSDVHFCSIHSRSKPGMKLPYSSCQFQLTWPVFSLYATLHIGAFFLPLLCRPSVGKPPPRKYKVSTIPC